MHRSRRQILLVEDDAAVRDALRAQLTDRGFSVETASHGQEALNFCRQFGPPDAIVLDLMMPVMNGLEFLEAKAADQRLRSVPVLLLTAHDHAPIQIRSVVGVFRKPRDIGRMMEALDQLDFDAGG